MIFSGTIQSGKLLLDHKPGFQQHLHTLEGKRIEVSVEKYRRKRDLPPKFAHEYIENEVT